MSNKIRSIKRAQSNGKVESLSPDALAMLSSAKNKLDVAQVGYNAIVNEIVQQYKLTGADSLDLGTGVITREVKQ